MESGTSKAVEMVGFQTSFFFLICLSNTVESYPLICPSPSEWRLRSDSFSNCTSRDYMCLYNRTSDSNSELCGNPEAYHKGVKLIWNGNVDAANCSTDRFQPFNFRTNESSTCVFLKSTCQEEGQLKNDTGSGLKDVKCICDEEKGFRFLHTPINKNFCISSEEDCTCFSNAKVENAGLTEDVKRPNITSQLSQQQNYTEYNQDGVVMITIVIVLVLGICISMMVWLCTIVSDVKLCVNNDQSSSVVSTKDTMALLDHEDVKVKTGEDVDAEQATSSTVESNTLSNKKYPHDMYRKNENSEYPTGGIVAIQPRKEQEQTPVVRTCGKLMQSDDNDGKGQSKRLNNELDREQILLELLDTKREYWREQEKLFYETSFVQDIMHSFRFRDCHSKLLIGSMSSGKSVTAAHIALQFETLKYTIFFIRNPDEFERTFKPNMKQVFVVDDPFGKQVIDMDILLEWEKLSKKIENGLNENTKIIMTMRSRIFSMHKSRLEESFVWKTYCKMYEIQMPSKDEKMCILEKHCTHNKKKFKHDIDEQVLTLVKNEKHFPNFLIWCYLISSGKNLEINENPRNPHYFVKKQIQSLKENRYQFCSLVLAVLFDGTFDINLLTECDQKTTSILKSLDVDPHDDRLNLQNSFEHLFGTFYRKYPTKSEYNILNDSITKAVVDLYGPLNIKILIEHASSSFIGEYLRMNEADNEQSKVVIAVPSRSYNLFAKRLLKDLTDGNTGDVLCNQSFNNSKFLKEFYSELLTLNTDTLQLCYEKVQTFVSSADTKTFHGSPLVNLIRQCIVKKQNKVWD